MRSAASGRLLDGSPMLLSGLRMFDRMIDNDRLIPSRITALLPEFSSNFTNTAAGAAPPARLSGGRWPENPGTSCRHRGQWPVIGQPGEQLALVEEKEERLFTPQRPFRWVPPR